ncbi:MAG: hypothetical protein CMM03_11270 [Rhodopirellula sp.]|nr:hypothetical protein [Rhodopirellula sp.]|tara:strand:+ start:662 stop:3991 length:3330 start_codon:yes stop_codon:yes gene_type:complete
MMQFLPILSILLLGVTLQDLVAQQAGILPVLDRKIDYASDVAPIFEKHCVDCHGVDVQESNLRVDVKASLLRGGDLGEPAILKGKGADSFLIQVVAGTHKDLKMPPEGKGLSDTEVSILRTWIDQGVEWPGQADSSKLTTDHWSFQEIVRPAEPQLKSPWVQNAIDKYILAALQEKGIQPSDSATPLELLRRLRLINHGLPPTAQQMKRFSTPGSYSELVDEILESPHFGERWASHWLDLVRFGETTGYEVNRERPNAFHYRDYVIAAFNQDKPYDVFVKEQIAGDQIGDGIGTGFLVAGPNDLVKSSDPNLTKMQRQDELADYINATGTTFLGLTIGCARCHNHKFDAITQRDYYAMQAVFAGVRHGNRPLSPSPDHLEREAFVDAQIRKLETELLHYVDVPQGSLIQIDESMAGQTGVRGFEELQPKRALGKNVSGTGQGQSSDAGDSSRLPNISGGSYFWWDQQGPSDLGQYHLLARGTYRIWLSWGAGPQSHATDVQYVLDRDGDVTTREDQTLLAEVNQLNFADGSTPQKKVPLWSGVFDAGVHDLTPAATVILRRKTSGKAITTDVLLLEPATKGDKTSRQRPNLRSAVTAAFNREVFKPVQARYVRMTISAATSSEPCLDELSIFAGEENVGLVSKGAIATASSNLPGYPIHQIKHLNDGVFGNSNSWISNESGKGWAQIELPEPSLITSIEWSRDRQGKYTDRVATGYRFEISLDGQQWQVVASSDDRVPFQSPVKIALQYRFDGVPASERELAEQKLLQLQAYKAELSKLNSRTVVYAGTFTSPEVIYRLYRGDFNAPREAVGPDALEVFGTLGLTQESTDGQRRSAFANWVASPDNPLTARVIVNRLWQFHFGTGIVDTPSDLGRAGTLPTHPELLDFLASELIDHDWSLKHIHRLIMESATYQQSSQPRKEAVAVDASARYLWRFPPRRLEAEVIRDSILQVSGSLDTRMGGTGFPGFEVQAENVRHYFPIKEFGPQHWRRMVYMTKVRQEKDAVFGVFDCPDASQVVDKRSRSTTPLQALNLFNSTFVLQQCEILAEQLEEEFSDDVAAQVRQVLHRAFGRIPDEIEIDEAAEFVKEEGLVQFCRAIFNANEFVFVH